MNDRKKERNQMHKFIRTDSKEMNESAADEFDVRKNE